MRVSGSYLFFIKRDSLSTKLTLPDTPDLNRAAASLNEIQPPHFLIVYIKVHFCDYVIFTICCNCFHCVTNRAPDRCLCGRTRCLHTVSTGKFITGTSGKSINIIKCRQCKRRNIVIVSVVKSNTIIEGCGTRTIVIIKSLAGISKGKAIFYRAHTGTRSIYRTELKSIRISIITVPRPGRKTDGSV